MHARTIVRALPATVALAGVTLAPASAFAQRERDAGADCQPSFVFDLDFGGGTLNEYIQAIQRAQPCANIVLMSSEVDVSVPPISLRRVSPAGAISLVQGWMDHSANARAHVQVREIEHPGGYTEAIRVDVSTLEQGKAESHAAVYNLAEPLTLGRGARELLGAIEAGLSVFDGPAATIKFHEPTGLLIVRGGDEQIGVVSRVVDELRGSSQVVASREKNLREQLASLRFAVMEAGAERDYAGQKLDAYGDALEQARQRVEAGAESSESLRVAELGLAEAERDFRVAEARFLQARERMERIEEELARITRGDDEDGPQIDRRR